VTPKGCGEVTFKAYPESQIGSFHEGLESASSGSSNAVAMGRYDDMATRTEECCAPGGRLPIVDLDFYVMVSDTLVSLG
jgi:hypothetical protein